ncbi:flagellar hook-basal body complex protein FliE [Xenorhabdus nematophila]|uniref:Flagellar hook-basal body complex protein FliE n=1 Tax=Xenorhabdus nematophila (strain ATCC 19061 / DSM 3370 / CCUG 14189 / LMG 1036 / NCIMB 9965 / AN6) TaxID=406817 RepID=D3VC89_XENNA|nr:flagellar hook-basal body complex protein FliE [Xenorhabdus nematophila]CEE92492.1 flagellar biosynthesis; basal-body component [Xenorhabdus nematophila str. Anatoliense]CBJ89742.1 flagellar biosynthesis; basal-body component [Xenorhabdus nematophila ATCC 19061]CCW30944.1 Flagellar hook-basal body complex protein FliE [Xenorhabdus nematophila F1]CEE95797.1 flagellar biosynthesis; basal-body component [Xenorhabdus nematophila str. Anatoliense]CEK22626.1 flagellar biosynthesis; basal-body com
MSIQAIEGVLQQMQVQALQAANIAKPVPVQSGFASQLTAAVEKINQTRLNSDKQAKNFTLGVPGVELNDVMVNMQKSSISLQMGIQVRNKLVSAYHEIMNMQV